MKKRINKKLSVKNARIITLGATGMFSIFVGTMIVIGWIRDSLLLPMWACFLAGFFSVSIFACAMCAYCEIISDPKSDLKEKNKVFSFLNKDMLTELYFTPRDNNGGKEYEIFLTIIQVEGYRFFAKLNENEDIILIVKNQADKEIYRCEISNYSYFNARFKPKSN